MIVKTLDFHADLELRAIEDDDEPGTFDGYGSVFGVEDFMKDIVKRGAFRLTLREHRRKKRMPALLWQHDTHEPIGVWDEMKEDSHGLYVKGRLFMDAIPKARQAHALLKENAMSGLSIGYRSVKSNMDNDTGVRTLTEIELFEVSLVTFPALDPARVDGVKDFRPEDVTTKRELENVLRDAGFSISQTAFIVAGWEPPALRDAGGDELSGLLESVRRNTSTLTGDSHA